MTTGSRLDYDKDVLSACAKVLNETPIIAGDEAYFTCPFCGKPPRSRKFSANRYSGLWQCWSCGEKGNINGLLYRLGHRSPAERLEIYSTPRAVPPAAIAPIEQRDLVYRGLLTLLPLQERHRQQLLKRGLTEEEIQFLGCRSLPRLDRPALARRLQEQLGQNILSGVPGFYRHSRSDGIEYWDIAGLPGLIIPVRDEAGRIAALHVRPDDPADGGKYRWLSSGHLNTGAKVEAQLHFSWPSGIRKPVTVAWITEGEIKAHAIASRLNVLAVSVPGVTLWSKTNVVGRLRSLGITSAVLAYDADAAENDKVAKATNSLSEALLVSGVAVSIATWDRKIAKGIDDLILLPGRRPDLVNLRDWQEDLPQAIRQKIIGHRGAFDIPAEEMPAPYTLQPLLTVEEARCKLSDDLAKIFAQPLRRTAHVFVAPPGVGKTEIAIQGIIRLWKSNNRPEVKKIVVDSFYAKQEIMHKMRLAYLFPNKEAMWEAYHTHPGLHEFVVVQGGRNPDPGSPWCCQQFDIAQQYGPKRHSVKIELCEECSTCADCPYLQSLSLAHSATVVFACHETMFFSPSELAKFDVIIVDEEFLPKLVEEVMVAFNSLNEWTEGIQREYDTNGKLPAIFLRIIEQALLEGRKVSHEPVPALPLLAKSAEAMGHNLAELISQLKRLNRNNNRGYRLWSFERSYVCTDADGRKSLIVPLRLFGDLIRILAEELGAVSQSERETRLWMTTKRGLGPVLIAQVARRQVIARLRGATLVHLNATPNRPLLQLVFPKVRFHDYVVGAPMMVTQVDNSLYTTAYLRQPTRNALTKIQEAINAIVVRHSKVAVFCPMEFEPGRGEGCLQSPEGANVLWGHFGGQTRALNTYDDCEAIVVVGHFMWPPFPTEALVQALRWTGRRRKNQFSPAASVRRIYNWRRPDGSGRGRIVHGHSDPLMQATLEWSNEAEIIQAIGRARAVNRSGNEPVHVYLLTAAVTSLPVDRLLGMDEFLREISEESGSVVPSRALAAANASRINDAEERIRQTIGKLRENGSELSVSGIARAAGADRGTVRRIIKSLTAVSVEVSKGGGEADCINILYADGSTTPPGPPQPASDAAFRNRSPDTHFSTWDKFAWPPESLNCERRFGHPAARLYPYLGDQVVTTQGKGVLEQVFVDRIAVALDEAPTKLCFLMAQDVLPILKREVS